MPPWADRRGNGLEPLLRPRARVVAGAAFPVAAAAFLVAATASPGASASEPEIAGMGARSAAMAGTGAADADGYEAAYENPAGLVEPTRRRLSLGFIHGGYSLSMDGAPRSVAETNGAILGADLPVPLGGILKDRVAMGLAFYFPTNVLNQALAPYPDTPRLVLLDDRTQVVSALAALSVRLHSRFSVGVGVLVLASLTGTIAIGPDASGHISTISNEQIIVDYAPIIGVRARILPSLRVGAVFRGESRASYDITITNTLGQTLPLELPTFRIAGVAQFDPAQAALEAAWRPLPFFSVVGGVTWKHWSTFPLPIENATPATPPQPAPNFHDTVVPRLAVEVGQTLGLARLVIRGGYFYEPSPAPAAVATSTLIDADQHVVTFGAGLELNHRYGMLTLDLFGQWHHLTDSSRADGNYYLAGGTVGVDL